MQLNAEQVRDALPWPSLIEALTDVFSRDDVCSPVRHHHFIDVPGEPQATLLLMPAWIDGEYLGVKQVNVFPGNNTRNLPGLSSHYLLSCGKTGQPLGMFEGNELTARRTAAASALASRYLSREDSSSLLMVGAGRMGRRLIPAHMSVRPISRVQVWDRNEAASVALVEELNALDIPAEVCKGDRLQQAAGEADIISCATLATAPVIQGDWLKPGVHLDLVGSFTPSMREADNRAMQRCDVFVDTRAGALSETGDLIIPISEGALSAEDIVAQLAELCRGQHAGRAALEDPADAMTLFKSVGDSREDLAAAILAYRNHR
ncbi:ornithine cyclodeaminase family protein [Pseudomonas stutzeri]|uniref:Ornithine cyclodeaminase n=1 Tax=Stutzerimonas stutzeri TaxID=316 RepID=A0A2N8SZV6_STUST|nr:ornithine cyclodeaminase family protein [Stutzerimonas stutzeri]MCQ4248562.1 ornithine cyclodeaminase family protein [Stutzerimonas stutzeri]PNG07998.1 ornithine cyclodeaminase [Stutzerimonas stutzeri]